MNVNKNNKANKRLIYFRLSFVSLYKLLFPWYPLPIDKSMTKILQTIKSYYIINYFAFIYIVLKKHIFLKKISCISSSDTHDELRAKTPSELGFNSVLPRF